MGALASNRKRVDECFTLQSQSPLINYNYCHYSNKIDTHIAKKPRISYSASPGKAVASPQSVVSRLSRYPEPEKLRREVHAPCRSNRIGFLSSGGKRKSSLIQGSELGLGLRLRMGNAVFSSLKRSYENAKHSAFGGLQHIKIKNLRNTEVIDLDDEPLDEERISKDRGKLKVGEDGNEVKSVVLDDHRVADDGRLVLETEELDEKAVQNDAIEEILAASDTMKGVDPAKVIGSREVYAELYSAVQRKYSPMIDYTNFEIKSYEAKRQIQQSLHKPKAEKKLEELKKPGEDLLHEPFVPLTEEEEREVKRAFSNSNRKKILVTHENSNIEITGEMLQCLRPGAWLNDEVINVYLELLKERERREPKKYLNCHFFNTFFYKKLIGGKNGYDYKAVRRWTTQRKLGYGLVDCDKIFVPIHKEVHWCLAVINKKDKSLQYLDSLGGRDVQVLSVLARYFADEVKDKSGQEIDVKSWEVEFVEDLPEQQNGFDCGVFMIKYADFYSRGLGLHFSQENMPYFRRRTAKEILRLKAD